MRHRAPLLWCFLVLVGTVSQTIAATGCKSGTAAGNNKGKQCGGSLEPHSWRVQQIPTVENPFVFFHQRKSGGSTWRSVIFEAALGQAKELITSLDIHRAAEPREVPIEAFIPCFTHPCATWTIPNPFGPDGKGRNFTIYAGHLHWSSIHLSLPPRTRFAAQGHLDELRGLTNFRDPVTRVVSCLRFRYRGAFNGTDSFARLSADQLRQYLLHRLSTFGFGCNNEPFRLLSGYSDELEINELGLSHNRHLADVLLEQSKRHLMASVVGAVLERPLETHAVVSHYFPWLRLPEELPHKKWNPAPEGSTSGSVVLSKKQRQVILELNWPEVQLYDFAQRVLRREYKSLLTGKSEI